MKLIIKSDLPKFGYFIEAFPILGGYTSGIFDIIGLFSISLSDSDLFDGDLLSDVRIDLLLGIVISI